MITPALIIYRVVLFHSSLVGIILCIILLVSARRAAESNRAALFKAFVCKNLFFS